MVLGSWLLVRSSFPESRSQHDSSCVFQQTSHRDRPMQNYRNLEVWVLAHEVTLDVYRLTRSFPQEELHILTSQLRRSAVSVPSNIAEGSSRSSNADFARFLYVAMGSASELDYQSILARDLGYLSEERYTAIAEKIARLRRMLAALTKRVRETDPRHRKP